MKKAVLFITGLLLSPMLHAAVLYSFMKSDIETGNRLVH